MHVYACRGARTHFNKNNNNNKARRTGGGGVKERGAEIEGWGTKNVGAILKRIDPARRFFWAFSSGKKLRKLFYEVSTVKTLIFNNTEKRGTKNTYVTLYIKCHNIRRS